MRPLKNEGRGIDGCPRGLLQQALEDLSGNDLGRKARVRRGPWNPGAGQAPPRQRGEARPTVRHSDNITFP
eukprot:7757124-Pyramimonas_sp.AAC.1